jgi:tetratricopeptide (TPR) repeat protein
MLLSAEPFSNAEKSVLTGLLAAYMIHNIFVFDNLVSYLLFFSLLAYLHARVGRSFSASDAKPLLCKNRAYAVVGAVALVVLAGGMYVLNIRGMAVSHQLIEGLKPQSKGVAENLAFYKKAFARETIGTQETAEQVMQTALAVAANPQTPQSVKTEFLSFAEQAMQREIDRAPRDARLRMFIGGFLNRLGRHADALPHLETAHALSPAKQTIAFELANTYLSTGKHAEAVALLKHAFDDAPEFGAARVTYAAAAVYAGQVALADELIAASTDANTKTDERLVRAYFAAKQYSQVIALLKLRLEREPQNPQTHISLAAAYLSAGNRAAAIAEIQKTIELNPDFKQQGEYYMSEIRAGRNP